MERDVSYNIYEKLSRKYGMSIEQAKATCSNMEQTAKDVGLDFRFETMILTNTFDAHRLAMFAKSKGKMSEMTERILRAFYSESKHIGDHQTLTQLAHEVGLDKEAVLKMLASNDYSQEVRQDEQQASEYGIRSIPFFLLNKQYTITGAQPVDVFVDSLQQIIQQDRMKEMNAQEASCDEDGCEIPKK